MENKITIVAFTLKDDTVNPATDITSTITGMSISDGTHNYTVSRTPAAGPIYVAMWPTDAANLTFTAAAGTQNYSKSLISKTYAANNFYQQGLLMNEKSGEYFTIDSSGKKVKFSQGNLQASYIYIEDTWTWEFAEHQWDYIGGWNGTGEREGIETGNNFINGNGTLSANGTVDLFGWVGASSSWTGAAQYGITKSDDTGKVDGYGNVISESLKSDWGNVPIANGGGYTWRTLTGNAGGEWDYIFSTRSSGAIVNGTTNARYTHATINTDGTAVNGMILFPDGCIILPSSATWGGINCIDKFTQCTTAQWKNLEHLGCVFLPAAGLRNHSEKFSTVTEANVKGLYWSSTSRIDNVDCAYCVSFNSDDLDEVYVSPADNYGRDGGFSVRLVREVE